MVYAKLITSPADHQNPRPESKKLATGKARLSPQEIALAESCIAVVAMFTRDNECLYCFRQMDRKQIDLPITGLERTRDHYVPRSRGGRKTIHCCYRCNHLKRDMTPTEWAAFMKRNPKWRNIGVKTGPIRQPAAPNRIAKPTYTYDQTRAFLQLSALRTARNGPRVDSRCTDPIAELQRELIQQSILA